MWSGAIISAIGAFFLYLQGAPEGLFPAWVPYTAGGVVTLLGAVVIALKVQDRRYAANAGAILALALLAGCGAQWEVCEVDTWDRPDKPRPAVEARVRCSRTVQCDRYVNGECDGVKLARSAQ